jgi:HPt (histidine-containing phosphotransfer) domain-containing protein
MTIQMPIRFALRQSVDPLVRQCDSLEVSAIDPDIAGQLASELPREDFVRILRTFEDGLGRLAVMLEAAVGKGDLDGYRRAAHSLAGAAAAVGARRLEHVARLGMDHRNTVDPRTIALHVRHEAHAALTELAALAENPPGPG